MARIDALHWEVGPGDNWAKIADLVGVSRSDLLSANGEPKNNPNGLMQGQVVHIPFWKAAG